MSGTAGRAGFGSEVRLLGVGLLFLHLSSILLPLTLPFAPYMIDAHMGVRRGLST